MHDVVAHSLAVIIVQADGGRYAMAASPSTASHVLETVAATARDALDEMRRLIDLLRSDAPASEDRQIHRIDDLPALVDRARQAGLSVTLSLDPVVCTRPRGDRLPPGAGGADERHPARRAVGPLHGDGAVADGSLRVSIVDDGGLGNGRSVPDRIGVDQLGAARDGAGSAGAGGVAGGAGGVASGPAGADRVGHGLVGMRERTSVLGGTFDAGPRADGGWRVHAVLPLGTP